MLQFGGVRRQAVHHLGKQLFAVHLEGSARGEESCGLAEALVVGTEDDRHSPHRGLQHIVDAYAEAATHIGHLAIAVDARQQTEAVDNQAVCLGSLLWSRLGIEYRRHLQLGAYLPQMVIADDMGRDDEPPFAMLIEILDKHILVGRPARPRHKHPVSGTEGFGDRQFTRRITNLKHPVETGISHHRDSVDADALKQAAALLVLHEKMGDTPQHP